MRAAGEGSRSRAGRRRRLVAAAAAAARARARARRVRVVAAAARRRRSRVRTATCGRGRGGRRHHHHLGRSRRSRRRRRHSHRRTHRPSAGPAARRNLHRSPSAAPRRPTVATASKPTGPGRRSLSGIIVATRATSTSSDLLVSERMRSSTMSAAWSRAPPVKEKISKFSLSPEPSRPRP